MTASHTSDILVRFSLETGVHVHCECEELLEGPQGAQKHHNNSPAFHCLNSSGKQVGCQAFEVLHDAGGATLLLHTPAFIL